MGDLTVAVDYPSSPEVGKDYKITVKIYNTGSKAINVSGSLTVTFYVNNKVIDTKNVQPIGIDPYILISVMVVLVVIVGMLTLWRTKQKKKIEK